MKSGGGKMPPSTHTHTHKHTYIYISSALSAPKYEASVKKESQQHNSTLVYVADFEEEFSIWNINTFLRQDQVSFKWKLLYGSKTTRSSSFYFWIRVFEGIPYPSILGIISNML